MEEALRPAGAAPAGRPGQQGLDLRVAAGDVGGLNFRDDFAQGLIELLVGQGLEQVVLYAVADGGLGILEIREAAENHIFGAGTELGGLLQKLQPIHHRHPDVAEDDVRVALGQKLEPLAAVGRDGQNLEPGGDRRDAPLQVLRQGMLVLNDQYRQLFLSVHRTSPFSNPAGRSFLPPADCGFQKSNRLRKTASSGCRC